MNDENESVGLREASLVLKLARAFARIGTMEINAEAIAGCVAEQDERILALEAKVAELEKCVRFPLIAVDAPCPITVSQAMQIVRELDQKTRSTVSEESQ